VVSAKTWFEGVLPARQRSSVAPYGQYDCWFSHLETSKLLDGWMFRCGNIVLLTLRFLDVEKFTNLTPLSSLISCKLSFPIVGLKMSSLPTLALKPPNRIFIWYFGSLSNRRSYSS
jgi:hypothetical protein